MKMIPAEELQPEALEKWHEELVFYGFKLSGENTWTNANNGVIAHLSSALGSGMGFIGYKNASCSFSYDIERTPDVAKRLAEALLFHTPESAEEIYSEIPNMAPKTLQHIFNGIELQKEGIKDKEDAQMLGFIFDSLLSQNAKLLEIGKQDKELLKKISDMILRICEGWFLKHNDMSLTFSILPTDLTEEDGFVYTVPPVFIDAIRYFVYGGENSPQ
jgi:hypothetical protein